MRQFFDAGPRFEHERLRLRNSITSGEFKGDDLLCNCIQRLEKTLGWNPRADGGDWIELELAARERNMSVKSVADFLALLDKLDEE
jgi:hypothetical protein